MVITTTVKLRYRCHYCMHKSPWTDACIQVVTVLATSLLGRWYVSVTVICTELWYIVTWDDFDPKIVPLALSAHLGFSKPSKAPRHYLCTNKEADSSSKLASLWSNGLTDTNKLFLNDHQKIFNTHQSFL